MTAGRLRLLVIEDNPGDARLVEEALVGTTRFELDYAERLDAALARVAVGGVDVVLLDLGLPDSQGLDGLARLRTDAPTVPVVVVTVPDNEVLGHSAIAAGAQDFLVKGRFAGDALVRCLRYAVERQQLLAELKQANDKLQGINDSLRNFVTVATHDLRSPITSIVGFAAVLTRDWATLDEEDRHRFAATIDNQSGHLNRLVDELFTLSSLESGGAAARPEPVVLRDAIRRCLQEGGGDAGAVSVECPPDLVAWVDPLHLGRILDNFVQNAFKYGEPPVSIEAAGVGDVVEVRVRDQGPGVQADFLPLLFGKFARADTPGTRAQNGAGLGLSIVRGLAEANGGQARYDVDSPGGPCFVVVLPVGDLPTE